PWPRRQTWRWTRRTASGRGDVCSRGIGPSVAPIRQSGAPIRAALEAASLAARPSTRAAGKGSSAQEGCCPVEPVVAVQVASEGAPPVVVRALGRGILETIADPTDGLDVVPCGPHLLSEALDVGVHGARGDVSVHAPD